MPDSTDRFVQNLVRPFEGKDAEAWVQADHEIRSLLLTSDPVPPALDSACDQLERASRPKLSRWWRLALYTLSLLISLPIAFVATHYWLTKGNIGADFSLMPSSPLHHNEATWSAGLGEGLSPEQRLLLLGDIRRSSSSDRWKGLWDSSPDDPAFFATYASAYLLDHKVLPPGFLEYGKDHDPCNAWFPATASASLATTALTEIPKPATTKKAHWVRKWTVNDPQKLDQCWNLLLEAASGTRFASRATDLANRRFPLFPKEDGNIERIERIYCGFLPPSAPINLRNLIGVVSAKAAQAVAANDPQMLKGVIAGWDRFSVVYRHSEEELLIDNLIMSVTFRGVTESLADATAKLGLSDETASLTRLKQKLEEQVKGPYPKDSYEGFSRLAMYTMMGMTQQYVPPPTPSELAPGRFSDHEFYDAFLATSGLPAIALFWGLASLYRFRGGRLLSTLSRQCGLLLTPSDWAWLLGIGSALPWLVYEIVSRTSFLGGRGSSLEFENENGPLAAFVFIVCLLIALPVIIARWRLGRRAGFLGLVWPPSWIAWIVVFLATGGWLSGNRLFVENGVSQWAEIAAKAIFGFCALWALATGSRALFSRRKNLLKRLTLSRAILPCYALSLLLVALAVPVGRALECYWLRQDHLTEVMPDEGGMIHFEYLASKNLRARLLEAWNPDLP
jgi:hypothetical protein